MSSSSGIVSIFKDLIGLLPIQKISSQREAAINVVSELADELSRGLELVLIYMQGARTANSEDELAEYFETARQRLEKFHSEFKICKGLRNLRSREKTMFDKLTYYVDIDQRQHIDHLLYELEKDERLIFDEMGDFFGRAEQFAARLRKRDATLSEANTWLHGEFKNIRKRQASIKRMAREFAEKI